MKAVEEEVVELMGDDSEDEAGARKTKRLKDPMLPTTEELHEHERTHLPYRDWCPYCVRGRGKEMAKRKTEEEEGIPEIHIDYCFPKSYHGHGITILAARERRTRMVMATVVPAKGTMGSFAAKRLVSFMAELGLTASDVIVKGDQEPAIAALIEDVARHRAGARTIPEHSPVGSSGSNGLIERAIQSVEAQVRTMKAAFENRIRVKIEDQHPVLTWLTEYAAFLLNRFEVGRDGKTAYERMKGKSAKVRGAEFGEKLLWKRRPLKGSLEKLTCLWEDGTFLGVRAVSGEILIGTKTGVTKTRTIQRRPMEERWNEDVLKMISGVPWRLSEDDPEADGVMPPLFFGNSSRGVPMGDEEVERVRVAIDVPRGFVITLDDIQKFGASAGCPGCKALLKGTTRQKHHDECRRRLAREMNDSSKVQKSEKREQTFFEKSDEEAKRRMRGESKSQMGEESKSKRTRLEPASSSTGAASSSTEIAIVPNTAEKRIGDQMTDEKDAKLQKAEELSKNIRERNVDDESIETKRAKQDKSMDVDAVEDENDDDVNEYDLEIVEENIDNIDPKKIQDARKEEMNYIKKMGVYEEVDLEVCWNATGKGPISTRWVDVMKSDGGQKVVRSRWVARDFKPRGEKDREDLFAGMPPLEAKKLLFRAATMQKSREDGARMTLLLIDVKKAHLNGICDKLDVFVELLAEARAPRKCGRLKRWLYGMRPAARAWEVDYSGKLGGAGMQKGSSSPNVFYDSKTKTRCVVHGDDFTFLGYPDELEIMKKRMSEWYDIKVRGELSGTPGSQEVVTLLNRTITWRGGVLEYRADDKHRELTMKALGLDEDSKSLASPIVKEEDVGEKDVELNSKEATEFRGLAARVNYLSQDRPDIQYAAKEVCRDMSQPTVRGEAKLKRLARYLVGAPPGGMEVPGGGHGLRRGDRVRRLRLGGVSSV